MLDILSTADAWIALLTLTFLEIVLGIDNIVFISIVANKLPEEKQRKATNWGLLLAMVQRIALLFAISLLVGLSKPFYSVETSWINAHISGQSIILFAGGLFLLYKSTSEIHEKVELPEHDEKQLGSKKINTLAKAIFQIIVIDFIFSIDSILTAVGMTNGITPNPKDALLLMVIAVIISILIMMLFANAIRSFISKHPSIQLLALSFLILIGFMLIAEAAHVAHATLFGNTIGAIPKGYLYFAITFSLAVEFLNMRLKKKIAIKQGNSKK